MKPYLNSPRLALQVVAVAVTVFAAACSERHPAVPMEPAAPAPAASVAAAQVPKPMRLVLLRPVMSPDASGDQRASYATEVVYLRPVMRGEPLPEFSN